MGGTAVRRRSAGKTDRGARGVALDLIQDAGRRGVRLDERLRGCEARKSLDAKDQAFVRELAYGTLRWRGRLDLALSHCLSGSAEKLPPVVLNVLRLGAYQILFTDRIPPWAAVNEAVGQVRARGFAGLAGLVNGVLRRLAREAERWRRTEDAAPPKDADALADAESHPRWMVRRWARRWGLEGAVRVCRANNAAGPLTLRVNRRRSTPEALEAALRSAGAEVARGRISSEVLIVRGGGGVRTLPGFRDGWFAVQDEAAALMAPLLGVRPGERVWDV
ncbi:MAG: transcription antitermination factor NusB, partial [Nitrospinota bacterium]|nr:transcription antitermination factor NusB [Nitrospinota bacterium]